MSFYLGFLFGVALGIGLIVGFARYQNMRSKRRSDLATTVAAFARMTVHDSRKILPVEFYPTWVVFSQRQKLTWLNLQLDKIWPYVNEAASELIRSSVEPILEQYRPVILSSLKFSKLTLGTVAPQFTGVSILEGDAEGVTMELEMQWDGNPNIELDVRTKVGVGLPIQVKNIGFTGVFRLIFKPLVDEFPCFGAVCFSLREKKNLDFTLRVVAGNISAIPGISDAIEETIRDAIEDSITWPVQKIIPILSGDYSDLELKPVGLLDVKLIEAKGLTNKDIIGKSDPYAVIFVRPLRDRMKTSKTISNQLDPIWNEHFEFIVEDASTQHLTIRIFDDEGVQASELIGCAQVALNGLDPGKVKGVWLNLVKDLVIQRDTKKPGSESVFMDSFNPDFRLTSLEKALKTGIDGTEAAGVVKSGVQKKKDVIVRGVLSVTVIAAENLPSVDIMGKSDPFVVLIMKKSEQKNKTRVVNNTLNPVWNQTFDFVVEDGLHDLLILEVWDHDTFGKDKMGRSIMTLTRVILEGEFTDTFSVDGTKSGKLHLHLKWNPQPIFRDP
ncbi:calcium-dependent lipid-binding (CaLB domain) family protein [Actinidia rufa]|uniref:Calcium-dependent lipid-binding (CaLB domain) family protein n=1 Tax=Actinidia rufa TaxID=165716 RepID=A0A7J0GBZ3_9ERIC|nr:calcium-dependent lipid-binding (CaLB domain) family protein [Actinidia rufa]